MSTYEPMLQDRKVVFAKNTTSKSITSEEHKNISPMHECYFSLNRKCGNTYFTLIEEQASIEIQLSLSLSTIL
jgi:hypothetical protein